MGQVEALFAEGCVPDQETRLTVQLLNHACQLQVSFEACTHTVHSWPSCCSCCAKSKAAATPARRHQIRTQSGKMQCFDEMLCIVEHASVIGEAASAAVHQGCCTEVLPYTCGAWPPMGLHASFAACDACITVQL